VFQIDEPETQGSEETLNSNYNYFGGAVSSYQDEE
jgi:hypothetical protein